MYKTCTIGWRWDFSLAITEVAYAKNCSSQTQHSAADLELQDVKGTPLLHGVMGMDWNQIFDGLVAIK